VESRFPTRNIDYGLGFYDDPGVFVPIDDQRLRVPKQKWEWFNDQTIFKEPKPGVPRVVLIGGSSIQHLYDLHDYTTRMFSQAAGVDRVEVVNMGGGSYGTVRLVNVLAQGLKLKPDIVIVYTGHNEIQDLYQHAEARRHPNRANRFAGRHSAAFRLARDRVQDAFEYLLRHGYLNIHHDLSIDPEEVFATYEENLGAMVDATRAAGAEIVLGIPVGNFYEPGITDEELAQLQTAYSEDMQKGLALAREMVEENRGEVQVSARHQKIIRELATRKQVPIVDMEQAVTNAEPDGIPGKTLLHDHCHLNRQGNELWVQTFAPVQGAIIKKRLQGTSAIDDRSDKMEKSNEPIVRTAPDIEAHVGETTLVYGTYVEVDIRKATSPPPVYAGHAAVRLEDGTLVLLGSYSQESAIRSEKERNELRDKEVIAEGLLHSICPPSPAGASLQLPCLYPLLYVLTPEVQALLAEE